MSVVRTAIVSGCLLLAGGAVLSPRACAETRGEVMPSPIGPAVNPKLPIAGIVADGEAAIGCWMKLDGSGSFDPLRGTLKYTWRQTGGPPLAISAADLQLATQWLFLNTPGEYRFALTVSNGFGESIPFTTVFNVPRGEMHVPEVELRRVVGCGERVDLPGEGWRQAAGPRVRLSMGGKVTSFRASNAGLYIFEAPRAGDVPERRGAIVPPGTDGALGDRRPVAELPKTLNGIVNKPLVIEAFRSFDPDPGETEKLVARWTTPDKVRGVDLEPLPNLKAQFKARRVGDYSVSLRVSDGRLDSSEEQVYIHITEAPEVPIGPQDFVIDEDFNGNADPRLKLVSLGLWGTLDRAVQLFPTRCGMALRVDAEFVKPEQIAEVPLALESANRPLKHLLDGITRQTDSVYRRDAGSIWLTHPLNWCRAESLTLCAESADALIATPDGSDLMGGLTPIFQELIKAREGASLGFEKPHQIVGVLPKSVTGRLKEIIKLLREPVGSGLPAPELPTRAEAELRQKLAESRITLKRSRQRLDFLLMRDLAEVSGLMVAFDPRQFPKDLPRVDVDFKDVPLRDAIRTLVELGGFDGCSAEAPAGLWFYKGGQPYPTGELLWDISVPRAYDMTRTLADMAPFGGEVIAHLVRQRVYPASWKEPGTGCFYHAPTRKLIVIHGPLAHRKVLEFLQDLKERGESALGAAEIK